MSPLARKFQTPEPDTNVPELSLLVVPENVTGRPFGGLSMLLLCLAERSFHSRKNNPPTDGETFPEYTGFDWCK